MEILPVIMCGGSETRFWPESRESLPKQFILLVGAQSTFQMAMDILADPIFESPVVISNHAYRFLIGEQLLEMRRTAQIVLEPQGRGSGPAIAVAAEIAARAVPDTIVAVLAANRVIQDQAGIVALCREAALAAAEGHIVTLGIKPNHAATGYGYTKPRRAAVEGHNVFAVDRFVEKPDAATAERYVAEDYLWNGGNFFFRADVMQEELRQFEPAMIKAAADAVAKSRLDLNLMLLDPNSFFTRDQEIDRLRRDGKDDPRGRGARGHRLVRCRQLGGGVGTLRP